MQIEVCIVHKILLVIHIYVCKINPEAIIGPQVEYPSKNGGNNEEWKLCNRE